MSLTRVPSAVRLRYRFGFPEGETQEFTVSLDPKTLALQLPPREGPPPAWTALGNEQCSNCPLKADASPQCPVAVAVDPVIAAFHTVISHREADIEIETDARTYRKRAPVSSGISGLIGILMATAGCPVLDRLRPMVRTHLPFATLPETMYRAASMYLLAQYFIAQRGGTPRWELEGLADVYAEVHTVNKAFLKRLRTLQVEDASLNAVVNLDCFATFTKMTLQLDKLQELEGLFGAYLPEEPA